MIKKFPYFILGAVLAALCGSTVSHAISGDRCENYYKQTSGAYIQRTKGQHGHCYLSVDPKNWNQGLNRGYLISDEGMLMIFDSFNNEETESSTGARVFYFFPAQLNPHFDVEGTEIKVNTAAPELFIRFDEGNGDILGLSQSAIQIDRTIHPSLRGGLEILNSQFLYLDAGYALGHDPASERSGHSVFYSPNGKSCRLPNKLIFNDPENRTTTFTWGTSNPHDFLKKHCPNFPLWGK